MLDRPGLRGHSVLLLSAWFSPPLRCCWLLSGLDAQHGYLPSSKSIVIPYEGKFTLDIFLTRGAAATQQARKVPQELLQAMA